MCSIFNIHQFKESCLNGRLVSMACLPSGNRRNPYRNCKNWPSLEHEILRVEKNHAGTGSVSAAVSRPAGWACRPQGVRVGRRQVPCRPVASSTVPAGANCRSRHWPCISDAARCKLRRCVEGYHKEGKGSRANLAN